MNKHLLQNEVPSWARCAVKIAAKKAESVLYLPMTRVQWISPGLHEQRAGWVNKDIRNTVFLNLAWVKENGPLQAKALACHEIKHLAQRRHEPDHYRGSLGRKLAEIDANSFAREVVGIAPNILSWREYD